MNRWLVEAGELEADADAWDAVPVFVRALEALAARRMGERDLAARVVAPLEAVRDCLPGGLDAFDGQRFGARVESAKNLVQALLAAAERLSALFERPDRWAARAEMPAVEEEVAELWARLLDLTDPLAQPPRPSSGGEPTPASQTSDAAPVGASSPAQVALDAASSPAPTSTPPAEVGLDRTGEGEMDAPDGEETVASAPAQAAPDAETPPRGDSTVPSAPASVEAEDPPCMAVESPRVDSTAESSPAEPAPPAGVQRPALVPWIEFLRGHWVDPQGQIEAAPWTSRRGELVRALESAQLEALEARAFHRLDVCVRALEMLGEPGMLFSVDLDALRELLRDEGAGGRDPDRAPRLRKLLAQPEIEMDSRVSFTLLLEVLAPTPTTPVGVDERDLLLERGQTPPALAELITEAHKACFQGREPLDLLRAISVEADREEAKERWRKQLSDEVESFVELVRKLWSGAGGKIERSHCRQAWRRLAKTQLKPVRDAVAGLEAERATLEKINRAEELLEQLRPEAHQIAEAGSVRYQDRSKYDNAVSEIVERGLKVIGLARRLKAPPSSEQDIAPLRRAFEAFRETSRVSARDNGLHAVLNLALTPKSAPSRLLEELDVRRRPALMEIVDDRPERERIAPEEHLRAAALLLAAPPEAPGSSWVETARAAKRGDLLAFAVDQDGVPLSERTDARLEREEGVHRARVGLEESLVDLDELADSFKREVVGLLETAPKPENRHATLFARWLEELRTRTSEYVEAILEEYRQEHIPRLEPDERARAERDLGERRLARLVTRFHVGSAARGRESVGLRLTNFREGVAETWTGLDHRAFEDDAADLVKLWRRGTADHQDAQKLRNAFYRYLVGEGKKAAAEDLRSLENHRVRVSCSALRKWIQQQGMKATFVPQLASFEYLVVVTPRRRLRDSSSAEQEILQLASGQGRRDALIVLCPGLDGRVREDLREHLSGNERVIALVDDIDLYRLLRHGRTGVNGLLGLVEIVLEQVQPRGCSPFESGDGQDIKVEMFVGRDSEVKELAESSSYSRIFSGRKLGKSALLKYLEKKYEAERGQLASGNRLEVIYVNIGGIENEEAVVRRVIDAVKNRVHLDRNVDPGATAGDPADRLVEFWARVLEEKTEVSFLVVLDEADGFVHAQVQAYLRMKERCLSFKMAKTIPGERTDTKDLPRVRFLLAGYRTTNTTKGAWANAGQVQKLPPLDPEEAKSLFEGPLARMGYDVRDHAASVAHRCGLQPAVILKFGKTLLERLARKPSARHGGRPAVTRQDVVETFSQAAIQDEIFTIIDNNFQGSDTSAVVFFGLAVALDQAPREGLEDAPSAILQALERVEELDWFERDDEARIGEIKRQLEELVERSLIEVVEGRTRLKFPHFLPVIVERNPARLIRQRIEQVRTVGDESRSFVADVLPPDEMKTLAELRDDPELQQAYRAIVIGSPWSESLLHDRGGIRTRLGLEEREHDGEFLVDASGAGLGRFLASDGTDRVLPIFLGGMGLLRAAISSEVEHDIEILGQQRFSPARLQWWFNFIRGLEFSEASAFSEIHRLTSGIPVLVGAFDASVSQEGGGTVSAGDFAESKRRFREVVPDIAAQLQPGSGHENALGIREAEILRRVSRLVKELDDAIEVSELALLWNTGACEGATPFDPEGDDERALELLVQAGLLGRRGRDRVWLHPEDALFEIMSV